jgi:membrane protease YdiL (CAAX protease family)
VLLGLALVVVIFITTSLVLGVVVRVSGHTYVTEDIGDCTGHDVFSKAEAIGKYANERLRAATLGRALPEPPVITADIFTLRMGFAATLASEAAFVVAVALAARVKPRNFVAALGLGKFDWRTKWVPVLLALGANLGVAIYAITMENIDQCGPLTPISTVPTSILNDNLALTLAGFVGVIAAPLCEEILFRGFFFRGLLRLGFAPAALASAVFFAGSHLDPGSLIPFTCIGLVMAYLFWRRGSLWDSITFHCAFNSASFALLLASR